jgi:LysR family hydrogen peroxide-inducible transcriptional activator
VNAHDLTLRQLQYVVAVADSLGFHRAARACHVSQPALSTQVAQIEDALGLRIFERDRRRVLVTPAGAQVVAHARRVLLAVDDLVAVAKRHADPLTGTLRVGVIPTIAPYALPELSGALRRRFRDLTIEWHEDKTRSLVDELGAGRIDAALLAETGELGDVEWAFVARDAFVLAAPMEHRWARAKGPIALRELRSEEVLVLEDGHCLSDQALEVCERARAKTGGFRATSLATLAQMVAQGTGVTLLPEVSLPVENRRGALAVRRFDEPVPGRDIILAWRPRSPVADTLKELAAAMAEAWPTSEGGTPRSPVRAKAKR